MGRVLPPDDRRRQVPQPALARAAPGRTPRAADLRATRTTRCRGSRPVGTSSFSSRTAASGSSPGSCLCGGGEPRQAPELQGHAVSASWSPDGRSLLVIAPSGEQRFVVGDPEAPLARRIRDLTWRLDGFGLRDQFHSAWVVALGSGKPRRLTSPAYEVGGGGVGGRPGRVSRRSAGRGGSDRVPAAAQDRGARRKRAAGPAAARPRMDAERLARRPDRARRL